MLTNALHLNVGGYNFTTSIGTLSKDPKCFLSKLAYDNWALTNAKSVEPDVLFLDRDGTHFRYILNFFRDGDSMVLPEGRQILREIRREAEYYEIGGLQDLIDKKVLAESQNIQTRPSPAIATFRIGNVVQWRPENFEQFWTKIMKMLTMKGFVDWICCESCKSDVELRLPELPHSRSGWDDVKKFVGQMKGRLDGPVNDTCVLVTWRNVLYGKDGYLDSLSFSLHVPLKDIECFDDA